MSAHLQPIKTCGLSEASFYEPLHPGFPNIEQAHEESSVMELNINESNISENESQMELDVQQSSNSIIEVTSESDTQSSLQVDCGQASDPKSQDSSQDTTKS